MSGLNVFVAIVIFCLITIAITTSVNKFIFEREQHLKEAENKPLMYSHNWDQHLRRLNKFKKSNFRGTIFYADSKGEVYYINHKGILIYCEYNV